MTEPFVFDEVLSCEAFGDCVTSFLLARGDRFISFNDCSEFHTEFARFKGQSVQSNGKLDQIFDKQSTQLSNLSSLDDFHYPA